MPGASPPSEEGSAEEGWKPIAFTEPRYRLNVQVDSAAPRKT